MSIDNRFHAYALMQRRNTVSFEQRRRRDGVAFEPGEGRRPRNGGKYDGGEQSDDCKDVDDFQQDTHPGTPLRE